jgi:hypothetical protein
MMDLPVSRFCSNCGKPINFGARVEALCPDCQQPYIAATLLAARLDQGLGFARPPWSLAMALGVLFFFMLAMTFIPAIIISIWAQARGIPLTPAGMEQIMSHPQATLVGVVSISVVHLLTLLITWTVITGWERRFTDVVDWSWHPRFRLHQALITVALLYGLTWLLQYVLPSGTTEFDKLLETSQAIRIAVAMLAVVTAPIVEELVYRGILYPAVQAKFGRVTAIVAVAGLFALVHFPQYSGSVLILVSLTLLSFVLTVVRAYTGKLLPCFVIHFVYNLIGVTLILIGYGLAI